MGILGFIGAGMGYIARDIGSINFELIHTLFPAWAVKNSKTNTNNQHEYHLNSIG